MENGDPISAYRQFLESFSNKIDNLSQDECETPFRLSTFSIAPSEVEGECLEWTRRYLSMHECPVGLVPQLSRAVYKNFHSAVNLVDFYLETDEVDENDDDDSDDSDEDGKFGSSSAIQLSSNKLLQEVISFVHSTVKTWRVVPPVLHHPPTKLHVCSHAIKNTRRKMEDRHVILSDFNTLFDLKDSPSQSYFAVFDGHGGLEAAEYAATHLHCHLVSDDKFDTDPALAMTQAYKATDVRFLEKAKREGLRSGTTGVSVFIRESKMYIGWLGDSQALLVRGGQPIQIMNPHKPEREDERRRIEELGGCVLFIGAWRVNGNISVSRAIGDAPHKPFISSDADSTTVLMTGEEEYLVLACDGLWDVLSPARVTQIVYKHSISSPGGLDDAAIGLVNAARDVGSSDNISVVLVLFKSNLSKPQSTEDSDLLLSFKDVGPSNNLDRHTTESSSSSSTGHQRMNERLKSKPAGGGGTGDGERELLENLATFIKGSTSTAGNHSNLKMAHHQNHHHHHQAAVATVNSSSRSASNKTLSKSNSSHFTSPRNHNGGALPSKSSSIHETPFSHELMRQALFYICKDRSPREDSQLMALALGQAMRGEKQNGQRKKVGGGGGGSSSERGGVGGGNKFARQGSSSSRSPRRPSVRPLSRVSLVNSSTRTRASSLKGRAKRKSPQKNSSKKKTVGVGQGGRFQSGETMWTSDEDDMMSVASQSLGLAMEARGATWPPPSSTVAGGNHHQGHGRNQQTWHVDPVSLSQATTHGSAAAIHNGLGQLSSPSVNSLNLSRNLPTLLGKSLTLGNRSVLPGIESSPKHLSNSYDDISSSHMYNQQGNRNRTGIGAKRRVVGGGGGGALMSSSSILGTINNPPQTARPAYGRGYSFLSDSFAMGRRNSKLSINADDFKLETASQYSDSSSYLTKPKHCGSIPDLDRRSDLFK